ncbi:MAG: 50S ribosomal protein L11 methyltransferase [Alphaproteobacteria bacterium]
MLGKHVAAFEAALAAGAEAVSSFSTAPCGLWRIEALFAARPERAAIEARLAVMAAALGAATPEIIFEYVPETDWVAVTRASFPPIRVGRYYVHGTHLGPGPAGTIDLAVDAGPAFGSGEHETTRGCLIALDALARRVRVRRALDMGCGSGILAIAAAKTWGARVVAADIDARAVRTATDNARANGVARLVRAVASDGYRSAAVRSGAPYDLIVANILARPLMRMAPDLARRLAPGGVAVLSGLLARQERAVAAAHRAHGLALVSRVALGGWHTLVLARKRCAPAGGVVVRRPSPAASLGVAPESAR